jgi:hypothetical protein
MGSSANWSYGYVPTTAQWNATFAGKQDDLGYTPVNRGGDTMAGPFSTFASTTERAGFTIQPGVDPTSPVDGNIWFSPAGLFARVNGSTVGPISVGTVTSVGLTAPPQFAVSNSPVVGSGSLTFSWNTQTANLILAGPVSGGAAAPTFRALVAADLPDPTASLKGGVKAKAVVSNQFLTSIGTDGTPAAAQPSFSNISGQASAAQLASGAAASNLGYTPLNPANNLSDVVNPAAAATNIGAVSVGAVNTFTKTQKWAKGANVASAAALTLGTDGNYFDVTGTTTITSIATIGTGTWIKLHFNAALTLTHDPANLILPYGTSILTAAGDEAEFVEYATGQWRCTNYQYATQSRGFNSTGTAPVFGCRAWVNFNGNGTVAIRASGNVSSITDNGVGDYTINFTTALPDANYSAVLTCGGLALGDTRRTIVIAGVETSGPTTMTTTALRINVGNTGSISTNDNAVVTAAIFR